MAPLIGISAEPADVVRYWGTDRHQVVDEDYVTAVRLAGGMPVLLPVGSPEDAAAVLERLDGLVLTGGNDIDPAFYGEAHVDAGTGGDLDPERDRFDLALARRAIEVDLPTLAICRGQQVLNVACGGTLVQHLPDHGHTPEPGTTSHALSVDPTSRFAARFPTLTDANSYHHQCVGRPGDGVRVVATAPDGVPEAIEVDGAPRVVSVQWHPEILASRPEQGAHLQLFRWLVDAAAVAPQRVPVIPARAR